MVPGEGALTRPLLLGIDVGTTLAKAVLIDRQGREVGAATRPTPFESEDDRVEMEVEDLRGCLAAMLAALGDSLQDVVAAGVAGMAESGAALDRDRRPVTPVIAWHDRRGEEQVARLDHCFGDELALRIGQPVRTVLTAAKLGWLLDHGVRHVDRWLGVPELVLRTLTGTEATEYSLAARTGCYDVRTRQWMPEVAEAVGFDVDLFPPIRPAGEAMGRVTRDGARWSGLPPDIPVTVAGHDHLAGMAGAGVPRHWFANSVGTAETLVARIPAVPDIAAARDKRVAVTVFPGGDEWAALVSAARAGVVLDAAARSLGRSLADLDALAESSSPVDVADLVDPLAHGESPSLPDAPPGRVWSGLLDALAARTADGYQRLAAVVGPAEGVVLFGGGTVSSPWLRAKTAALPVQLRRSPAGSAVARGAAVHAGVAAGWWPSADDAPPPTPSPDRPPES